MTVDRPRGMSQSLWKSAVMLVGEPEVSKCQKESVQPCPPWLKIYAPQSPLTGAIFSVDIKARSDLNAPLKSRDSHPQPLLKPHGNPAE